MNFSEKLAKGLDRTVGIALWLLIFILTLSLLRNINNARMVRQGMASEEARVKKMEEDNARLATEVAEAQSQDFIEKQIRDKLGLVKSGEAIVVLPDPEILRKLAPSISQESDTIPDPNWKKWLKLFM